MIKSDLENDKKAHIKSLVMTNSNFIFTMICAGVKPFKRQITKLFDFDVAEPGSLTNPGELSILGAQGLSSGMLFGTPMDYFAI